MKNLLFIKEGNVNKFSFCIKNVKNSLSQRQIELLPDDFFDASYIRVFEEENLILTEKYVHDNKCLRMAIFGYSFTDCTYKFEVKIPDEYKTLYFTRLSNNGIGMVCKHKDETQDKAIECEIDKESGEIIKTRSLPCSGYVMFNNREHSEEIHNDSAVKKLEVDKAKNIASWSFNNQEITIKGKHKILYLVYSDFQETILMISQCENGEKRADLYNLDGTYRLNIKVPAEFEILEIPCSFGIYGIGHILNLWLENSNLHIDELRYTIVPDNGDLIFTGAIRL